MASLSISLVSAGYKSLTFSYTCDTPGVITYKIDSISNSGRTVKVTSASESSPATGTFKFMTGDYTMTTSTYYSVTATLAPTDTSIASVTATGSGTTMANPKITRVYATSDHSGLWMQYDLGDAVNYPGTVYLAIKKSPDTTNAIAYDTVSTTSGETAFGVEQSGLVDTLPDTSGESTVDTSYPDGTYSFELQVTLTDQSSSDVIISTLVLSSDSGNTGGDSGGSSSGGGDSGGGTTTTPTEPTYTLPNITAVYSSDNSNNRSANVTFNYPESDPGINVNFYGDDIYAIELYLGSSTSGSYLVRETVYSSSSHTISLSQSVIDEMYKKFGNSITQTITVRLISDHGSDTYTKTVQLTGIMKTAHVGVNDSVKRADVWVSVDGVPKRAIAWVGVDGVPKRCI